MGLLNTRENSWSRGKKRERMKRQLIPFKQVIIISILETYVHGRPDRAEGKAAAFTFTRLIALAMQTHQASSCYSWSTLSSKWHLSPLGTKLLFLIQHLPIAKGIFSDFSKNWIRSVMLIKCSINTDTAKGAWHRKEPEQRRWRMVCR